jgi:ribosomal protein L17
MRSKTDPVSNSNYSFGQSSFIPVNSSSTTAAAAAAAECAKTDGKLITCTKKQSVHAHARFAKWMLQNCKRITAVLYSVVSCCLWQL